MSSKTPNPVPAAAAPAAPADAAKPCPSCKSKNSLIFGAFNIIVFFFVLLSCWLITYKIEDQGRKNTVMYISHVLIALYSIVSGVMLVNEHRP
jgi:hypothetical protein